MQINGAAAYQPPAAAGAGSVVPVRMDLSTGVLTGAGIRETSRTLGQLQGLFGDQKAQSSLDPELLVYRVQAWQPVPEGEPGGLFWGATFLQSGLVGDEYFMTKGHFHALRDRAEYYVAVQGEGALILMDESRRAWFEPMLPGSVHYIPARVAHRVANTGPDVLTFFACWPSDAGHDYHSILEGGFSARFRCVNGRPELIVEP